VLDELEVHQVPVLLGDGRRLFDGLGPEHIELELERVIDAPGVTHLRYRVRRSSDDREGAARRRLRVAQVLPIDRAATR
jgi:hypothetical protein